MTDFNHPLLKFVQTYKYDGSIESYNHVIEKCFPYPEFNVIWVDEHNQQTNKFTGIFEAYASFRQRNADLEFDEKYLQREVLLKPGDNVIYPLTDY